MNLDSCMPETSFRSPSKSAESHASKSAKDARRRRLELRRIRSSPQPDEEAARTCYGKISVVGRRREMDNAVAVELGFVKRGRQSYDFYGVFDGQRVARACRQMLAQIVTQQEEESDIEWEEAFHRVAGDKGVAGSAAVVGDAQVVVAGSKAVLSRGGVAVSLLEGQVSVAVARRSGADEFLILGSNGFWDVISHELACQIARRSAHDADAAAALMAEMAVAQGSKHNVSVLFVDFRPRMSL